MGNLDYYLRLLVQADKEARVTVKKVTGTPAQQFTSALTSGQTRKRLRVYNASDSGSGELYYGFTSTMSPSGESMSVKKDIAPVEVPIAETDSVPLYFCCDSGEQCLVRVEELA
jgi:hypothetical protein